MGAAAFNYWHLMKREKATAPLELIKTFGIKYLDFYWKVQSSQ